MLESFTSQQLTLENPLINGLVSAAIHPRIKSVLVFGASPFSLREYATIFADMIQLVSDKEVRLVYLTSNNTEDDLWGSWNLTPSDSDKAQFSLDWQPGLLGSARQLKDIRLVVIPDLMQLSLVGMRACVTAISSDIVHLERYGQHQSWKSNLYWIAGCSKEGVSSISPHLLDQFTLRLTYEDLFISENRSNKILKWLAETNAESSKGSLSLPKDIKQTLAHVDRYQPKVISESLTQVELYISLLRKSSIQRSLSLMWLAQAQAVLQNAAKVTVEHVDKAAKIIGLRKTDSQSKVPTNIHYPKKQQLNDDLDVSERKSNPKSEELELEMSKTIYGANTVQESSSISFSQVEEVKNPYLEDDYVNSQKSGSLRLTSQFFQKRALGQGAVIGSAPAKQLNDLALVSTLLESIKYQYIRRKNIGGNSLNASQLILSPTDLRCYRRASIPVKMLILVIDHTCLKNCKWEAVLLPYLIWAYQERASICLVQIGARLSNRILDGQSNQIHPDELRAQKLIVRSVLVPNLAAKIISQKGRATPLAHGL